MKIGVTAIGYECAEHLDKVLDVWSKIKKDPKSYGIDSLYLNVCHAIFPEVHQLGFPIISTDGTIDKLQSYKYCEVIDGLCIADEPMFEKDARNQTLDMLLYQYKVDILWLLDLQDEIYTEKDVKAILNFIRLNDLVDVFKINFKNYAFAPNKYVDDFVVPRIWRTNRHMGIKGFYYDNEIMYKDGTQANMACSYIIPKNIAFPKHYSWFGSSEYLKRKIDFQTKHYGMSSYKWNDKENKLDFNLEYYKKYNKPIPPVFIDTP